jgi:hypothetical protein
MKKIEIKVIGDKNWKEFRNIIVENLIKCNDEERFKFLLFGIAMSVGDLEHIKEIRKAIGVKPLDKKEEKEIKKWETFKDDK